MTITLVENIRTQTRFAVERLAFSYSRQSVPLCFYITFSLRDSSSAPVLVFLHGKYENPNINVKEMEFLSVCKVVIKLLFFALKVYCLYLLHIIKIRY